ncbi:hypothetical protein [Chenggangzhangella methanolivorans]|uniref:Uncharacterized protein n=1 Tax=Chenggangzhangella methanolivorans TaxID=1437009 RepID=A0A9E6UJP8_9HYPH|nr:hypothetical protein [Chenggangzhangella methanolivorans]QZN98351.1 hypothetical protein K6K41_14640 [Chenggangzhangella methanolivorans]
MLAAPSAAFAVNTGGAEFTAVIAASGKIKGGSGVGSVIRVATGVYQMTFPRFVDTCAAFVSLNDAPGFVFASTLTENTALIQAKTFDAKGKPKSLAFSVLIKCQD